MTCFYHHLITVIEISRCDATSWYSCEYITTVIPSNLIFLFSETNMKVLLILCTLAVISECTDGSVKTQVMPKDSALTFLGRFRRTTRNRSDFQNECCDEDGCTFKEIREYKNDLGEQRVDDVIHLNEMSMDKEINTLKIRSSK